MDMTTTRKYCKAYDLAAIEAFPTWKPNPEIKIEASGGDGKTSEDQDTRSRIVFLHTDLRVTAGIYPEEDILWQSQSPEWAEFCAKELAFDPPTVAER
jgi:hypothetical protein